MAQFRALVLPAFEACHFQRSILAQPVIHYIFDALSAAGGNVFCAGSFCGLSPDALAGCFPDPEDIGGFFEGDEAQALLLFAPAPTLTAADILGLLRAAQEEGKPVSLKSAKVTLAVAGALEALAKLDLSDLQALTALEAQGVPVAQDAESVYAAQETLRRRINLEHMKNGVFFTDPSSCFISPAARLAPGCQILPGCTLAGGTVVGPGCVIGPNAWLQDAVLGENVRVNTSHVHESTVGAGTTVGPFAYIRPGCDIGENVRVGDFVELKKSRIGAGTKVSHLTYIGDSDFGSGINVGCGVVTVNYDGKAKHKTIVEDGAFVGCNVNLVAPVRVGREAYLAAGSTITEDVPTDSLVVARARAVVKPHWVSRRRAENRL